MAGQAKLMALFEILSSNCGSLGEIVFLDVV